MCSLRSRRGGRPKIVQQEDVDLFAWLKTIEPTMSLKSLKDNVLKYSNSLESITLPTISKMINNDLNLTLKRVSMSNSNRFTLPNLQYTKRFLQYVNNKDPSTLKFMDGMGFILTDGNKTLQNFTRQPISQSVLWQECPALCM